ncbi:MAG: glycoside hydrolase family 97 N-terminal domain-containing protein, partial [Bacteroidaceae bacterium]|nr:glycoside hydrolase family 97 N-terminal domain-containing protein [Bacteroidaceae bacterium]
MKKMILAVLALASIWSSAWATEKSFTSPDGKLTVVVEDQNGIATYRVNWGETEFIGSSPLGVNTNMGNYTNELTLAGCEVKTVKESYDLRTIKQSHVDYEATEAVCSFEKQGKKVMDVIFRVSNRDVAFRYRILPQRDTKVCVVNEEASGFKL